MDQGARAREKARKVLQEVEDSEVAGEAEAVGEAIEGIEEVTLK
jgi:hypothetical protein